MALQSDNSMPVHEHKKQKKNNKRVMAASVTGSTIGIAMAVAGIYTLAKKNNPSVCLKNFTYDEKDILMIGAGSVSGGLLGGLAADKNSKNKIPKLREASLQFFGSLACPLGILAGANHLLEKSKFELPQMEGASKTVKAINTVISAAPKIAVTLGSLVLGMNLGNKIMNNVNNKIFNQKEHRDVQASDYLVHADDICVAASLLLKDSKSISAITSKVLPASFILAGAKTGMQEA